MSDVVPVGCFDGVCVYHTAEDAHDKGFAVHFDRDLNIAGNEGVIDADDATWQAMREEAGMRWDYLKGKCLNVQDIPSRSSQKSCDAAE